jgi:signal transduction histidine kinase
MTAWTDLMPASSGTSFRRMTQVRLRWDASALGWAYLLGVSAAASRLIGWRSWGRGDIALAGAVAALSLLDVWFPLPFVTPEQHRALLSIVFVAGAAALLWRRRAPLAVLAFVVTSLALMYLAIGAPEALGTFLQPWAALYAVGRYSDPHSLFVAGPLVLLGTALHELKDPDFQLGGPAIFYWALLAAAWPLGQAFHRREVAVHTLSRDAEKLRAQRAAAAEAAAAAERSRISRELHDVIGHAMSVVVLQLVAAVGMLDKGELAGARDRLVASDRGAREALAEMRRLVNLVDNTDAALAPQPRLTDLHRLVTDTRTAGVAVDLAVEGDPVPLPPGLELAAYRVTQEALTNVIKHAPDAAAQVRLSYQPGHLEVCVSDDGRPPPATIDGGRGIAGMCERVAVYHGHLTVGPRMDGGFEVRARFPISGDQ